MFVEALKQLIYGWLIDWFRGQLDKAQDKVVKKQK